MVLPLLLGVKIGLTLMKTITSYERDNKLWHFMCYDEEKAYFYEVCDRIIANPRFYLENLDELSVFKVSFINYKNRKVYKASATQ